MPRPGPSGPPGGARRPATRYAERPGAGFADGRIPVFERADEGRHGALIADQAERPGGGGAHDVIFVAESIEERLNRTWIAERPERRGDPSANLRIRVLERGQQRFDCAGIAVPAESLRGIPANEWVLLEPQRLDQPGTSPLASSFETSGGPNIGILRPSR